MLLKRRRRRYHYHTEQQADVTRSGAALASVSLLRVTRADLKNRSVAASARKRHRRAGRLPQVDCALLGGVDRHR